MENEKLDLQVGDRITYKYEDEDEIHTAIISDIAELKDYILMANTSGEINSIEILKIERPKYEVVEENKELLTKQEKEFLKLYMQFTNIITNTIYKKDGFINFIGYTVELALYKGFDKLVENKLYTLKELGLEEK